MTRKEEIEQQAMNSYPDCPERGFGTGDYEYPEFHDDEREAFIEGAQWADKTMIDKACEWLKLNAEDYVVTCYDKGELDSEGLLTDFRKAMEE